MIQKFTDLVTLNFYLVFIAGLITIGFLAIGTALRKPKYSIISAFLTVLLILGFVFSIYNRYKYAGKLEIYLSVFMIAAFIHNLVVYVLVVIKNCKFNSLLKSASSVESIILAYLNDKGRVLHYTLDFLDLFNVGSAGDLKTAINYIHQDEHQYSLKSFLEVLADEKEDDYNLTIDLSNSKELKLGLSKRKVISKGNLLGYVLINQKQATTTIVETSSNVAINTLNLVSEATAIYESDTNKFVLNKKMQVVLGVEEVNNLDDFVYYEDRKQLEKRAKAEGEKSKIFYRIETQNGRFWAQESIRVQNSKLSKVIKETDFKGMIYSFRDYSRLTLELDQLLMSQNNFALVFINIHSLNLVKEKIGKDASLVLATQFFGNLNNEIKDLKVFEIGYYKYAFFIRSDEVYNNILKDLNNNNSGLLKAVLNFNDMAFELKSYVGLVDRRNVSNPTSEGMLGLAEEALRLASNKDYSKDFSMYFSMKKKIEEDVKNIDLSDDFLDKLLK